jgi:glycosyltransferase involved in cell wall biosynthesis
VSKLVSIVVLCHNYGRFLREAVDSALAQTHPACEVLIVDNGSTDESFEVARGYGGTVRLIRHQRNQGVQRAFNNAVAQAQGDYVARLDADDRFQPEYVEQLLQALDRSPDAVFAYCRARMFGARSGVMRCFPFSAFLLAGRTNFVNASALTSRAAFLEAGGYSEDVEHHNEDWDLWLKLVGRGKRGTYVRAPLLNWRRHPGGSRNPEAGEPLAASVREIRARHRDLVATVYGPGGRVGYAFDFAVAAADVLLGLSRFPRLARALERRSWSRFQRRLARSR